MFFFLSPIIGTGKQQYKVEKWFDQSNRKRLILIGIIFKTGIQKNKCRFMASKTFTSVIPFLSKTLTN
jgi:hypothetical protein